MTMTDEAIRFLSAAIKGDMLSYKPREDPLIADLLDEGYLTSQNDTDPDYETLARTRSGVLAVVGQQGAPEGRLPPPRSD